MPVRSWLDYLSGKATPRPRNKPIKPRWRPSRPRGHSLKTRTRDFRSLPTPKAYDNYIHFLVQQGRSDEALDAADQSRARTLAQGLGLATTDTSFRPATL